MLGFDFLDLGAAMKYSGNDESLFIDTLRSYMAENKEVELQQLFEAGDWKNYGIRAHSIKGISKQIGALLFSDKAKRMEEYGNAGDGDAIRANHEKFLKEYRQLIDQIWEGLSEYNRSRRTRKPSRVLPQKREAAPGVKRILVIDDEKVNLDTAARLLKRKYLVLTAESGREGFDILTKVKPDLILLDVKLPEMDGFDILRRLKAGYETNTIPVIMMSANEDTDTEIRGLHAGVLDFVKKPLVPEILEMRIRNTLNLQEMQHDLEKKVEEATRHNRILTRQVLQALASTVDAKDHYTSGHSTRVAEYSREIARRVGKTKEEQDNIYFMGLLHDIGKIGVPEEIINKTSRLTDEEFAKIKEHPVIGYEILEKIEELPSLANGARWHHERYDGRGYPDGKKGMEIPEEARIIGVADAYDAMTSNRAYSNVRPQEQVRAEIERCKGSQFDPIFADIMLNMIDEDVNYDMREKN